MRRSLPIVCGLFAAILAAPAPASDGFVRLRIATFNLQDVHAGSMDADPQRMERLGAVIRALDPDILLLNEIGEGDADDFVARFVARPDRPEYHVFQAPSNTGVHSGFDLDNDGTVTDEPGSRQYGADCWGYGEFPGQYAMALLVRDGLEIIPEDVRTFRDFPWKDMPGALLPPRIEEEGGAVVDRAWYSDEELAELPLSSKSHWDVPVRLPGGAVLHLLCSHPTPPVFDGPEDRNGRRNHDEIRFWHEYLENAQWIVDDRGRTGGLPRRAPFVILGDLNADPDEGDALADPVGTWLLNHPWVNETIIPSSDVPVRTRRGPLDPDDTAMFGLRVDYVLPYDRLNVVGGGVLRGHADLPRPRRDAPEPPLAPDDPTWTDFPSDHFPVWIDIVPAGGHAPMMGEPDGD